MDSRISPELWERMKMAVTPVAVEPAAPAPEAAVAPAPAVVEAAPAEPVEAVEDILAVLGAEPAAEPVKVEDPAPAPVSADESRIRKILKESGALPAEHHEVFEKTIEDFTKAVLTVKTAEEKAALLNEVAKFMKIPGLTPEVDAHNIKSSAEVAELRRELDTLKGSLKDAATRELKATVDAFKSKHPDFEDHRAAIGKLLKAGVASNLDEAYRQARLISGKSQTTTQAIRNDSAIASAVAPKRTLTPREASLDSIFSKYGHK